MDTIAAIQGPSPYMRGRVHLSIYINGKRLDEWLAEMVRVDYLGLIPAWLPLYDEHFLPGIKEAAYVRQRLILSETPVALPVLLCPDDFDFSCTVIVAEVFCTNDTVVWRRLGTDVTPFDPCEQELPPYIGKQVNWFDGIGPFTFEKAAYAACVSRFTEGWLL